MVPTRSRILLLLAVCFVTVAVGATGLTAASQEPNADPENDTIGWEDGQWHDEPIPLDQSDGLNETERDAFLARSIARVEVVKDTEIALDTQITFESSDEYAFCDGRPDPHEQLMENVRWEAGFAVGEERDAGAVDPCEPPLAYFGGEKYGGVVVVVDDPQTFRLDGRVLVHELAHAVQPDATSPFDRTTIDGSQARSAVVEGEANWVTAKYARRCGDSWNCERHPEFVRTNVSGAEYAPRLEGLFGYAAGPGYVADLVDREGYDAVAGQFAAPPNTTEQVIHRTDEPPLCTDVESPPRGSWAAVADDRLGEMGVYTTFWYASYAHGADVMDPESVYATPASRRVLHESSIAGIDGPFGRLNYTHPASTGWGGDRLVAYSNGSADGYVWKTRWDTERDAREFHEAYREVLAAANASERGNGTWVVTDGPFADAFRVVRDGTQVVIVNGPTVAATTAIHPASTPGESADTATQGPDRTTGTAIGGSDPSESCLQSHGSPSGEEVPMDQSGFGSLVAILAVLLVGLVTYR